MNNKEKILKMYYEDNMKQIDIAKNLNVSQSYISQVIRTDKRYKQYIDTRHKNSLKKKSDYNKEYYKNYNRPKNEDNSYQVLQAQLSQDASELFYHNTEISDYTFAKWNSSIYTTNKNWNLALIKGLKVGADVPKIINMNIKIPTQKYKHIIILLQTCMHI